VSDRRAIPIVDLAPGLQAQEADLLAAVARVLRSGTFIGGPEVEAFEAELAAYLGVQAVVGVNSGTDALCIGLRGLGVSPGDEVLVPAFGFIASAEAVSTVGGVPVFVDVEPGTLNVDPAALEAGVTPRTKGLIAVHLFGQTAAMDELLERCDALGLWVLEDAAQALGGRHRRGRVGSLGRAAALSFFPTKNLGGCGDGGAIATDDLELATVARSLRQHGSRTKYVSERLGHNSRLDALQAAILRVKLPGLDVSIERRRAAVARYDALLGGTGLELPSRDPRSDHTFHQYTVRIHGGRRDGVQQRLAERGIATIVHYPLPLHLQPVYRASAMTGARRLPSAEAASQSVLSLPFWPEITPDDQRRVASALVEALADGG
jgi:dTDP-4-amino-4,6-dideoxygalactose transaminase